MTNKEASNVLRLFANLIEINGLPQERILTFRKAYEQAISELESDTKSQGKWILKETDCDDGGNNRYECSKCHYTDIHSDSADVPYCWHCGSIMKGGVK